MQATAQQPAQISPSEEIAKMLPASVGDFRAQGAPQQQTTGDELPGQINQADYGVTARARRRYVSTTGAAFDVQLVTTVSDAAAFSLLTRVANSAQNSSAPPAAVRRGDAGTASAVSGADQIAFFKGSAFVTVTAAAGGDQTNNSSAPADFARAFAATLGEGSGMLPVLVLHLPEWEKVFSETSYAVSLPALKAAVGNHDAVLDAVSFEGGVEAASAKYANGARVVIVEYTTPQYASDNDARINARIAELRGGGQPVPSDYRRIGNYSVFVFDAPDEQAAQQLASGVKYEKDVRWLGDNPRALDLAQRAYGEMTGNVILGSLKLTGLSILLCLGVGGVFGGAVFLYRRAQTKANEVYSDAGGMVRLNIDEITPDINAARLLESGKR